MIRFGGTSTGALAGNNVKGLVNNRPFAVVSVTEFGAKGDGSTDDTTAIQGAINAVATNGGVVYFPPGKYVTTATIKISTSGVSLVGAGRDTVQILAGTSNTAIDLLEIKGTGTRLHNIVVSHLTLISDARAYNPANGDTSWRRNGVLLDASLLTVFDNVKIDHFTASGIAFADAYALNGPDQVFIKDTWITTCQDGVYTAATGHSTHIIGGTYEFCSRYGINTGARNSVFISEADIEYNQDVGVRISNGSNFVIQNCTFESNARAYAVDSMGRNHIWVGDFNTVYGARISGCFFHADTMRHLVRVDKSNGVTVADCYVYEANKFSTTNGKMVYGAATAAKVNVVNMQYDATPNVAVASDNIAQEGVYRGAALPTAAASYQGRLFLVPGGTGVADAVYICVKTAADTYAWQQVQSV